MKSRRGRGNGTPTQNYFTPNSAQFFGTTPNFYLLWSTGDEGTDRHGLDNIFFWAVVGSAPMSARAGASYPCLISARNRPPLDHTRSPAETARQYRNISGSG